MSASDGFIDFNCNTSTGSGSCLWLSAFRTRIASVICSAEIFIIKEHRMTSGVMSNGYLSDTVEYVTFTAHTVKAGARYSDRVSGTSQRCR